MRSGRAEFVPIKVGIAGDKYFEVVSGLKEGDQVITGPYNSVRGMADGDLVKVERKKIVNKFLDSAAIALAAIWSAKLRSFMTVLGNIVAVTSIIAVVSLIQGLNASVKDAIVSQAGADSFNIQQFPVTRSDEDFDKVRSNPRISLQDVRAIRRYNSPLIGAVMAGANGQGRITYRDRSIDSTSVQGLTADYVGFSGFNAERGRLMTPTEVDMARPVTVIGWQTADRLFGPEVDPLDKIIQIEGIHFRIVGVSEKKGSILGRSQDEFALIPLGQFQMMFGSRRPLNVTVKPRDLQQIPQAMDDATIALRSARGLKPKQPDNFGMYHVRHDSGHLSFGHQRDLRGARRRRGALARRRRHRDHEHHADGGDRAHAGNRPAQGARRAAVRHHGADADRVGGAVGLRRRHRHDCGRDDREGHRRVHADPRVGRDLVDRARHRHHGARRAVLRLVSGDAGGAARSD